jgi:hypothetical protein
VTTSFITENIYTYLMNFFGPIINYSAKVNFFTRYLCFELFVTSQTSSLSKIVSQGNKDFKTHDTEQYNLSLLSIYNLPTNPEAKF